MKSAYNDRIKKVTMQTSMHNSLKEKMNKLHLLQEVEILLHLLKGDIHYLGSHIKAVLGRIWKSLLQHFSNYRTIMLHHKMWRPLKTLKNCALKKRANKMQSFILPDLFNRGHLNCSLILKQALNNEWWYLHLNYLLLHQLM